MAATTKKKTAKRTSKKTARKSSTKKSPTAGKLPATDPNLDDASKARKEQPLPRGQERLPDGRIRLKTGDHDLPAEARDYDVHGVTLSLSGKVLVASKNVNWLSITKCQKCGDVREHPVEIDPRGDYTVVSYRCENDTTCQIGGGRVYIAVYESSKLRIKAS